MWGHAIIVFLTKLSRLCQRSVTALSPHCHHIAITSPPHCHHIAITSPTHRRPIAATSPPHRRHIAATSPPHRRRIAATLPPHRRHIAATSPPHCRHIAATSPPQLLHGSSHLQAKRNPCSQSVTFHQRPKIVPTHRQIKTCFFDDDTALLAVLLQGRRHAAALYDWCDLKWRLWPSNAVIEWALIRLKNQARVTLGRCKSALCMCSKKEKRSDVKWVFVSGAGSIQLELCSINGLETTAVCFWQRMNSHVAKVTTWTNVVNLNSGFFDVSVHQYIPSPGRGDEFADNAGNKWFILFLIPRPVRRWTPLVWS